MQCLIVHLLEENHLKKAVGVVRKEIKRANKTLENKRPKLEKRLVSIERGRRGPLELLESGVEPKAIRDRLLVLDQEERDHQAELSDLPPEKILDPEVTVPEYRGLLTKAIAEAGSHEGLLSKREVRTAIRELVQEVIIYPKDDPHGRDIELVGDIEKLIFPTNNGMETMVPGGGIEPPTRGFSIHCSTPELPGHGKRERFR